jgi:DNA-directed RNA polymerase specialized sigma24 family protein
MPNSDQSPADGVSRAENFNTTHWSEVLLAGQSKAPQSDAALEKLCRTYWYPLYAYVRRQGHSAHDAQDLTQEFFARLLEKKYLNLADQARGQFRSFLLKSLHHFLVNDWVRGQALKRGGGQKVFSLDEAKAECGYQQEPAVQPPECLYDQRWAVTLLNTAMERLGRDYAAAGKRDLFERLKSLLLNEGSSEAYAELTGPLAMSEGAIKVAVHRLRQRFREAVRMEVAQTLADPADIEEELRSLRIALSDGT